MGSLVLRGVNGGAVLVDGQLNNLIPDGSVGDAAAYWFTELVNTHASMGVTGLRLYVAITDTGGGTFAVAVADATARSSSYGFTPPAGGGLTFTTSTTPAAGLALPDLAAGTKALICVRRDLTGATAAWPETNAIGVAFTPPLGYV